MTREGHTDCNSVIQPRPRRGRGCGRVSPWPLRSIISGGKGSYEIYLTKSGPIVERDEKHYVLSHSWDALLNAENLPALLESAVTMPKPWNSSEVFGADWVAGNWARASRISAAARLGWKNPSPPGAGIFTIASMLPLGPNCFFKGMATARWGATATFASAGIRIGTCRNLN